MPGDQGGLEDRYIVIRRSDGKVMEKQYFCLSITDDPHAKAALWTYAISIKNINPQLFQDIKNFLFKNGKDNHADR